MTAKEFLRQARYIDRRIDAAIERRERMRARLETGRRSTLTGMPRGGAHPWTDLADRMIDLDRRLDEQIRRMVRLKLAAVDAIAAVEDARMREVLELYYLDGFTWEQVAERMKYDVRWIYRLHGKALLEVRVPEGV